jgi:hypothetical protein
VSRGSSSVAMQYKFTSIFSRRRPYIEDGLGDWFAQHYVHVGFQERYEESASPLLTPPWPVVVVHWTTAMNQGGRCVYMSSTAAKVSQANSSRWSTMGVERARPHCALSAVVYADL